MVRRKRVRDDADADADEHITIPLPDVPITKRRITKEMVDKAEKYLRAHRTTEPTRTTIIGRQILTPPQTNDKFKRVSYMLESMSEFVDQLTDNYRDISENLYSIIQYKHDLEMSLKIHRENVSSLTLDAINLSEEIKLITQLGKI